MLPSQQHQPTDNMAPAQNQHPMLTHSKAGITKAKALFVAIVTDSGLPATVSAALADPVWNKAMQLEFNALQKNQTWTLVPAHPSMHIVGSKWVFKVKHKSNGTIERHKAPLVAQGFTQTPGLNYTDTFSPVIKPATVRIILTLAVSLNWCVHRLDFDNAFLNGTLQETVFMVNRKDLKIKIILHMCVSFGRLSMALNRLLERGSKNYGIPYYAWVFHTARLTHHFSFVSLLAK